MPLSVSLKRTTASYTRNFTASALRETKSSSDQQLVSQDVGIEITTEDGEAEGLPVAPRDANASDVPWYLQVEPPRHVAHLEPPPLPEVPPGSPDVIGFLLEYVSEELGLDQLSLLDLRKLDPPPALGPKLFMLFGTARSERHLHVSAGRLVRWLKFNHHIHAYADGLLGPNERKKKLKRNAKRAKLLGTMGVDEADDGIKTGWICVNLGTVGRGSGESAITGEDGRVAGFGVVQTGFTIVVQVMTEARRAEMDLENLWIKALKRSTGEAPAPAQTEQTKQEGKMAKTHRAEQSMLSRSLSSSPTRPVTENGRAKPPPFGQASFYSTESSQCNTTGGEGYVDPLRGASAEEISHMLTYDGEQKGRVLDLLTARLHLPAMKRQGHHDTGMLLGDPNKGLNTYDPTPFVHLSTQASRYLPRSRTWGHRVLLQYKARPRRDGEYHPPYGGLVAARSLIDEMRTYGIEASRSDYIYLLTCIYKSDADVEEQTALASELLRIMYLRGQAVLATDVIVTIIVTTLTSLRWQEEPNQQLVLRMHELLTAEEQARLPSPGISEGEMRRLIVAYATRGLWDAIWEIWGEAPRHLRVRQPESYVFLLALAAKTNDPDICARAARQCARDLPAEGYEISLRPNNPYLHHRSVRDHLLNCISVADPYAEEHARTIPSNAKGFAGETVAREFVKLVRALGVGPV